MMFQEVDPAMWQLYIAIQIGTKAWHLKLMGEGTVVINN